MTLFQKEELKRLRNQLAELRGKLADLEGRVSFVRRAKTMLVNSRALARAIL